MNLKYLTDNTLLNDTKSLAHQYRKVTIELIHHLKEIESRKLFSELGYSSLFAYVVQELGFSESSASRRLDAMKLIKEIPEIEKKIETGDLTLSNIGKAATVFKKENITDIELKKEVLQTIENTSARTCDKTLSEIIIPSKMELSPPPVTYQLMISDENYKKLEVIRNLLAHHKLTRNELIDKVFTLAINKLTEVKFKTSSKLPPASSDTRYIPAGLKKAVFERDKKCKKCGSTYALEVNHIKPFALGGKTELKNLNLLCFNCNQRARISSKLHRP